MRGSRVPGHCLLDDFSGPTGSELQRKQAMGKKSDLPSAQLWLAEERMLGVMELFGFLYFYLLFWKAVQKKIQQNVALKSKNQILSIKKFILTISSEDGKRRRPRMEEKSDRQLAFGMKAISLSTLQRKTGWSEAVAPRLFENCVLAL